MTLICKYLLEMCYGIYGCRVIHPYLFINLMWLQVRLEQRQSNYKILKLLLNKAYLLN